MNTILLTAYAINPYKGSEDGMGWNFALEAATSNNLIVFTRKNNRTHIEKYQAENPDVRYKNINFRYFDWPAWMLFWKKGPILSLIYFYFWQLTLAIHCRWNHLDFDIAHNLNFHNDWTPSFLWLTGKPMIWGPVGHHPKIKKGSLRFYSWKALASDRFLWLLKLVFWNLDPFLWITKKKAAHVLCMNDDAVKVLRLEKSKYTICPSVATEDASMPKAPKKHFTVISAGRFVPLKGFDITLKSFADFYHGMDDIARNEIQLHLVGNGPYLPQLQKLASDLNINHAVIWTSWIERNTLQKLYNEASVFLFPSYEGAGMVVAEAMVHALPVVCWDNSGPGVFTPKASKLKVNSDMPVNAAVKAFSSKLRELYVNSAYYDFESKLARTQYLNQFQWKQRGVLLHNTYQNVLTKNKSVPFNLENEKQMIPAL